MTGNNDQPCAERGVWYAISTSRVAARAFAVQFDDALPVTRTAWQPAVFLRWSPPMPSMNHASASLLRETGGHTRSRVEMVELFYDLVFVFAITQLSHSLLAHLSLGGVLRTGLLFMGVWWLWILTTWCTNWLNPMRVPVRLLLLGLMFGGMLLAASLPEAFADKGVAFGVTFAVMPMVLSVFMILAFRKTQPAHAMNFVRILIWLVVIGACWVLGGIDDPPARRWWWAAAVVIEFLGPMAYFRVPWLGASSTAEWDVDPHHMAERCALFVIIALGESLLVTGATFATLSWSAPHVLAFVAAFLGSVAMWWMYFDSGSERATQHFASATDRGRVARLAYTYLHAPIVAGIIVCAVADELVLAHPAHVDHAGIVVILGGPLVYLLGNALFKWVTNHRVTPPLSHLVGLVLLLILAPFALAHTFSTLALGTLTTAVMVLVAAWEWLALRRP